MTWYDACVLPYKSDRHDEEPLKYRAVRWEKYVEGILYDPASIVDITRKAYVTDCDTENIATRMFGRIVSSSTNFERTGLKAIACTLIDFV
jgi:hypothetical protein